jgi:signal peptidase II
LIDRLSKELVAKFFQLNQSLPVIKNIFHLTYIKNSGALWGILAGWRIFLIIAGILILFFITLLERSFPAGQKLLRFTLGLVAGGVTGNLFDRIFYGGVIDFLDFRFWPIFNLADTFTNIGVLLLIFWLVKDFFKEKRKIN